MKPVKFKEHNVIIAEKQDEYQNLPAYVGNDQVVSCWKLSLRERLVLLLTGKLWWSVMTFGQALQPQLPYATNPFREYRKQQRREAGRKRRE